MIVILSVLNEARQRFIFRLAYVPYYLIAFSAPVSIAVAFYSVYQLSGSSNLRFFNYTCVPFCGTKQKYELHARQY